VTQWFRYRRGVVCESLRAAHRVESIDNEGTVRSWCRRTFAPARIEEVGNPTEAQTGGVAPCATCVLRFEANAESAREGRDAAPVRDDGSLAMILRKAQWLLDDAAFYLPEGRCSGEDCELLAKTLDQLAALLRERAARCVVIDASTE
jgi:hypothetical protein